MNSTNKFYTLLDLFAQRNHRSDAFAAGCYDFRLGTPWDNALELNPIAVHNCILQQSYIDVGRVCRDSVLNERENRKLTFFAMRRA